MFRHVLPSFVALAALSVSIALAQEIPPDEIGPTEDPTVYPIGTNGCAASNSHGTCIVQNCPGGTYAKCTANAATTDCRCVAVATE